LRGQAAILELALVLVRDMESRIVLWTRGAERLYGFSKVEALGRVSHELFQTEFAEGKAHVDARLRDVGQWEGELVHRKRNGERLVASQQNVARHSKAGKVWVHLDVQDGMLVLGVEDDGVGISPESLGQSQSLRLLGMRERAAILGGQVEIAGIPGKGTTVVVRMPIQ
jgi:PAS domain-containing protein